MRRYELWSAERSEQSVEFPQRTPLVKNPPRLVEQKLDEHQATTLLYNYGLPVDLTMNAAAKVGGSAIPCKTSRISTERIDLSFTDNEKPPKNSLTGSSGALRIEEIGEVSGRIAAESATGFQFAVDENNRSSLAEKLATIAMGRGLNPKVSIASGTRLELKNKNCEFTGPDGRARKGRILNLSQADALIQTASPPKVPAIIVFRGNKKYAAEITNSFVLGFVARFSWPISDEDFSENMRFDN